MKLADCLLIAGIVPCIALGQIPAGKTPEEAADEAEIPPSLAEPEPSGIMSDNDRVYVEAAVANRNLRTSQLLTAPNNSVARYARVSGDARLDRKVAEAWRGSLSIRADARENEPVSGNDDRYGRSYLLLREAYVSHQLSQTSYIDVGRINLKNGIAVGFNPTDYFRAAALPDRDSEDTSVLRENRLGSFMVRAQQLWTNYALTLAYSPRLTSSTVAGYTQDPYTTRLWTNRTNAQNRTLLKFAWDTQGDFAPELSVLQSDNLLQYGASASTNVAAGATGYIESNISRSKSIAAAARDDAIEHNIYPPSTPNAIPFEDERRWYKQTSLGINYVPAEKTRIIVEYQRNDAGFSDDDWRHYFNTWNRVPAARPGLLQIRQYARDQQMPLSRNTLFMRVQKDDLWVKGFGISGLAFRNLYDKSMLTQAVMSYAATKQMSLALQLNYTAGSSETEYATQSIRSSVLAKVVYFF